MHLSLQETKHWLEKHHTDGINLSMKELLYYQNKSALLDISPKKAIQAKLAGSYLAKTKGRGMEFDEARHYQPGDDIRAIDWRVTARTGKTHTKLYREEKERPVFILCDLSKSMHFGTELVFKSVQAAHLTSLLAWAAKNRGDRIGGLLYNQSKHLEFKPQTRQKSVLALLNGLLKVHASGVSNEVQSNSFADSCARLRRLAHPGSMVFLISDFMQMDETAKRHLSRLSRHCELVAYKVSDPFEHQLPQAKVVQQVALTDGNQSQTIMLGEQQTAQRYQNEYEKRNAQIVTSLEQCRARVIQLNAGIPLEQQLVGR
jgi:uncharacterized protein (DUF58 family)